jgi:hypothetical protein
MKIFDINFFDNHIIIEDGKNIILVDTGAPSTIHFLEQFNFMSETYSVSTDYMGLTVDELSELIGQKITTLLGADILAKHKVIFDLQAKKLIFDDNDEFGGHKVACNLFMGIPIIEVNINNKIVKCFLDTGAKLSYLSPSFTQGLQSVGVEEDFYPGVGKFETDCYEISTEFNGNSFDVRYGNLPELLQTTLMMAGTEGIIGYDLFNNFKIMLNLEEKELEYKKYLKI